MRGNTKKLAVGANGYFYQKTTADRVLGAVYAGGTRAESDDWSRGPL